MPPSRTNRRRHGRRGLVLVLAFSFAPASACSRNPATGRFQFGLMNEQEEIRIGRETDAELTTRIGTYDEKPELVELVQRVGQKIAKSTERPSLPWSFVVLDDSAVNAFALPGGYVYVTRGLLAHLNSEAELAAVLGHEVGHVTARHSAVQLRKQRTARNTIGLFRVIDPNLRHVGGLAASTAGLVLLKHSRDDENEADTLALRYLRRTGYDLQAIVAVFDVLAGVSKGSARVPTWLSTHPQPEARRDRMARAIGTPAGQIATIDPSYLAAIDGIVYGKDPRDGLLLGNSYVHPRMGFIVDAPPGWTGRHDGGGFVALDADETSLFLLGVSEHESAEQGLEHFFEDPAISRGERWEGQVGGVPLRSASFAVGYPPHRFVGLVAYVDIREHVLVMIAIVPEDDWAERAPAVAQTFSSLRVLDDPALLHVEPMRIRIMELPANTTLDELQRSHPSVAPIRRLERLNRVKAGDALPAGRWVKRVEGVDPDDPRLPVPSRAPIPAPASTP